MVKLHVIARMAIVVLRPVTFAKKRSSASMLNATLVKARQKVLNVTHAGKLATRINNPTFHAHVFLDIPVQKTIILLIVQTPMRATILSAALEKTHSRALNATRVGRLVTQNKQIAILAYVLERLNEVRLTNFV